MKTQKEDSQPNVMQAPEAVASSDLLERALNPVVGDRFASCFGGMAAEVVGVSEENVSVEIMEGGQCEGNSWPLHVYRDLVRTTLNHGGKFYPSRSNVQAERLPAKKL